MLRLGDVIRCKNPYIGEPCYIIIEIREQYKEYRCASTSSKHNPECSFSNRSDIGFDIVDQSYDLIFSLGNLVSMIDNDHKLFKLD
jgi:hypothetical protein